MQNKRVAYKALLLQNESSYALDQVQTPKGLGNSVSDWHIWAQILHQFPIKFFIWKKVPKSISDSYTLCFPANSCQSCPKIVKMACQQAVYEQSNPVRTEQSLRYDSIRESLHFH